MIGPPGYKDEWQRLSDEWDELNEEKVRIENRLAELIVRYRELSGQSVDEYGTLEW